MTKIVSLLQPAFASYQGSLIGLSFVQHNFFSCQFKAASTDETCFQVPFGLVLIGVFIFQTCFVLAWGCSKLSRRGKSCEKGG